ncbi:nitrogenase component 1 family protein [Leptospira limi]|uniref:Ankyrin repeat domain-containing protein n=1 Tax=Leptospira limi TaxID=2950023 RepID=A0ABT3M205_9LEPT|nr:hypothetical protein [Leptospira limi]MCW7463790.1 hypothetical protein [Leptospira limi]
MRLKLFHIVVLCTILLQLNCYKITSSFKRVVVSRHLQEPVDPKSLSVGSKSDYRVFQKTPVWDLAYALAVCDLGEVEELAKKHKEIIDIILQHGGDPNLHSQIKYSHTDYNGYSYTIMGGYSPLLYAKILETLQLLVEAGGNIHHQNKYGGSLLLAKYMIYDRLDQILYLLEHGVDYKGVMSYTGGSEYGKPNEEKVPLFLVDKRRYEFGGLDTKWYQQKGKIIRFLASQGIDYWKTPIPQTILNRIGEMSKTNNWSERKKNEFISKY